MIASIWAAVAALAIVAALTQPHESAVTWFGAILAGSVAAVSAVHLIKAKPSGFVRELVYVGGGSYGILALVSIYLFIAR
jgi:hypothetical protein